MADYRTNMARAGMTATGVRAEYDEGLRAYLLKVYNYMAIALALTGVAAFATFNMAVSGGQLTPFGTAIYTSALKWVVMFAPLVLVFFLAFRINSMSVGAAQATFWVYSILVGVSLSTVFLVFTATSITQTFFITAAAFGALSLYGYTTKRDLSAMGSFMVMGLFGLIIAMLVNLFLQSSAMQWAISVIGVMVFAGLTAWDTQKIKNMYDVVAHDETMMGRSAIMGALTLYLDFINMFMFLLQFLGNRE
ncbi:MAG: membrane protein [Alphaproteobacteria bacterium]|nr:MAG: membrane protein [Alphaproteobacteria bacterium]